jgi:hypothetical protein
MPNQERDICAGGTVSIDESSFTFVNHHNQACNIQFLTTPPGANQNYTVPAQNGSAAGTVTVDYTPGITGSYAYTASCCPQQTNPVIQMQ